MSEWRDTNASRHLDLLCQYRLRYSRAYRAAFVGSVTVACLDERAEERMRLKRLGLELGMELADEEERMGGNLDDLHVGCVRRGSGDAQTGSRQQRLVFAVELIAVAM